MTIALGDFHIEIGCPHQDTDDLQPGPDGELACGDCRRMWGGNEDCPYYDPFDD